MSNIQKLYSLPDINFIEGITVESLLSKMIADYEVAHYASTGIKKVLAPGDPIRLWICSLALWTFGLYQKLDYTGKQNLLKYSSLEFTRHIGAGVGEDQNPASPAVTTMRFNLAGAMETTISIQAGTLVTPGNGVFFSTQEYKEIAIGSLYVDVVAECTVAGVIGNGYIPGQVNVLATPIEFISSVSNLDTTQGGAEAESNESLKERIYTKPESFSVAGPEGAYVYFTKSYSPDIADVSVISPSDGAVEVRFLLQNGVLPGDTIREEMLEFLSDTKKRPLTDKLTVPATLQQNYNIGVTYYIKTSDRDMAVTIQSRVDKAIDDYIYWQKTKFGRDINPSELNSRIINAGAKRAVITSPVFVEVDARTVGNLGTKTVVYGGLEDE